MLSATYNPIQPAMELGELTPLTIRVETANGADFVYRLIARRRYVRRDGVISAVLTWRGRCAVCHREFTCKAGPETASLPRTCDTHRGQWHSGSAKRRRATRGKA